MRYEYYGFAGRKNMSDFKYFQIKIHKGWSSKLQVYSSQAKTAWRAAVSTGGSLTPQHPPVKQQYGSIFFSDG